MRGFIIMCLAAVAVAAPQGYNYNPGNSGVATGFGGNFGGSSIGVSSGSSGFFQSAPQQQHQQQQQAFQSFPSAGVVGGAVQQQQQHHQQVQHTAQQQQQAIVSKRFYIHSAPEDVEEDFKEKHITVGVPKRNYNVVFIKSPQRSNKKTSIKISPAVNEDKTVIYVLSKKTDASDVQAEVVEHATSTTKPEVFFIKYKTAEEAAHAQQQIQAQYDALGGSSQVTDEGVAPVSSVIGALGGGDAAAHGGAVDAVSAVGVSGAQGGFVSQGINAVSGGNGFVGGVSSGSQGANNAYLPPNF